MKIREERRREEDCSQWTALPAPLSTRVSCSPEIWQYGTTRTPVMLTITTGNGVVRAPALPYPAPGPHRTAQLKSFASPVFVKISQSG